MIELTVLGPHAIRRSDGGEFGSLAAQPKRFALLAYLAIGSATGFHRRGTLAAVFWPELDEFAARRALRNTLYHLRETLGDGVIVTRGDDAVAIDPAILACDANRLADAVAGGRFEDALALHRGELLAGLHFADAGEAFEAWLARERARVVDLVMRALLGLVDRDERAGDALSAARWAQHACTLAPDDEVWVRRAMTLLDGGSDRSGALRLYATHARRLAAEFGAKPSAATEALAARIRTGELAPEPPGQSARGATSPRPAGVAPTSSPPLAAPPLGSSHPAAGLPSTPDSAPPPAHRPRPASRRTWVGTVAFVLVLGTAGLVARDLVVRRADPQPARDRVLVTVFENRTGDPALQLVGRMSQDWLTAGILRTQLVDVVDSRAVLVQSGGGAVDPLTVARRTGATMVVSGSYYRIGDTLLFQAALTDARTARVLRVVGPIATAVQRPVAALDALRSRVMTALALAIDPRLADALATSDEVPAFDAYRAYLEGWDAFWHGDGTRSESLFVLSARQDTAFAAAAVAAATAAGNYHDCALTDSLARALDRRAPSLDRFDRLSLGIALARCHGRNEEMLRLTIERAELDSRTSSRQMSVVAAALWANHPRQALTILERLDPRTDLGWTADTTHFAYWSGLTEALHLLGAHEEELAAADRVPRESPLSRAWMRGRALAALSRPAEVLALVDSALSLPVETANDLGLAPFTDGRPQYDETAAWVAVWIARELAVHGDTAASRRVASRAVAWYRARPAEERAAPEERLVAVWSLELQGEYADAERIARTLVAEDSLNVDYRGALAGLAAERADTARCDSLDRWLAAQPRDRVAWSASFYRARDAALLGRADSAVARVRESLDEGAWPMWLHVEPALGSLRSRRDFVALMAPGG